MNKKNAFDAKTLAKLAMFISLMLVLTFTGLGYILIGPISITTVHIPVIIGSIYGGKKYGIVLGLAFGLTSWFNALQGRAGVLSFIFMNPLISVLPRFIMGFVTGYLADLFRKKNPVVGITIPAIIGTLTNTILVLGLIFIFYAQQYAEQIGIAKSAVSAAILATGISNGIPEAILAAILATIICTIIRRKK